MKTSTKLIIVLLGSLGVVAIGLFAWFTQVVGSHMRSSSDASRVALERMDFTCPPGTLKVSRPAGKAGWMQFCQRDNVQDGPWMAASGGVLTIRGECKTEK